MPSRAARTRAVPLQGAVTFSPQPDSMAGTVDTLSSRLAAKLPAGLCQYGTRRAGRENARWLFICPRLLSRLLYQCRAVVGDAMVGDAHGSAWTLSCSENLHNVPSFKWDQGFDSEMPNHFQVKANVSLMCPHPRVKFLAWLSMAPHSDTAE